MKSIRDLKFWLKQALWLVPGAYLANFIYAIQSDQTGGSFGDTFGAANAFFSGTALLMLVLAVILQREELEQVKEERNDTRELLAGQSEINKLQRDAIERQIFEASFLSQFKMIVEEKQRLKSVVSPQVSSDTYLEAASKCATGFAKDLERDENYETIRGQLKPLKELRLLLRAILTLNMLITTSPITGQVRDQYFKLLLSVLDFEIAVCIGVLTIPYKTQALSSKDYTDLFEKFTPTYFIEPSFIEIVSAACAKQEKKQNLM